MVIFYLSYACAANCDLLNLSLFETDARILMADRATLDIGTTLGGRYELTEGIGEGGFGKVFRARQLNMDRDVAVKILPPQFASMENMVERFRQEARLASRLRHPNTITIHDYGQQDGAFFIVMEYLKGEDLAARLQREGKIPLSQAIYIGQQTLKSLQEAHEFGIVHRDLKPENVFLTQMGSDENFVKILDFGIAKLAEPDAQGISDTNSGRQRQLTVQGSTVGTPCYMSPEQAAGESVATQSDLYTLGVILYEMVNGHPPFMDKRPVRIMHAHLFDPLPAFSDKKLRNSRLESVLRKAMEKDPAHRYEDAAQFLEALSAPDLDKRSLGFVKPSASRLSTKKNSTADSDRATESENPGPASEPERHRKNTGEDEVPFDLLPGDNEESPPAGFSAQSGSVTSSIITVLEAPETDNVIVLTDLKQKENNPPDDPVISPNVQPTRAKSSSKGEWSWEEEMTTDASGSQLLTDFKPDARRRPLLGLIIALIVTIVLFIILTASGWIPLII